LAVGKSQIKAIIKVLSTEFMIIRRNSI